MAERPALSAELSEKEFLRWYWTLAELQPFARSLGLSSSGAKALVTERIAAHLGGRAAAIPVSKPQTTPQLSGPLTTNTVIPLGQKSTTVLRQFFLRELGNHFTFDGHMRQFLANSDGATLGDAIDHWHATRGTELPPQSKSLEFNAFTKEWHRVHPDGSAADCRAAWGRYRSLPSDERPSIGDA